MRGLSVLLGVIGTTFAQNGGGGNGQGGNLVNVNNCTASCDLESCNSDDDCATVWERFQNNDFIGLDNFVSVFDNYCNTTGDNATYTCDNDQVDDLYDCIIYSDCWDTIKTTYTPNCTYYSEFTFSFTVYSADGTYTSTQLCNPNWNSYVSDVFGDYEDAVIRLSTSDCDDTDDSSEGESESEGEDEGEGGSGNDRRLLQEGESESSEGESEDESSEGEGDNNSGGSSECADVTYTVTVGYISDYTNTDGDLANVYGSLATELQAQTSLTNVEFYIRCYENTCCNHIDSEDSACTNYISTNDGTCSNVDYTCSADASEDASANGVVITTLLAFVTIMGFLFAH